MVTAVTVRLRRGGAPGVPFGGGLLHSAPSTNRGRLGAGAPGRPGARQGGSAVHARRRGRLHVRPLALARAGRVAARCPRRRRRPSRPPHPRRLPRPPRARDRPPAGGAPRPRRPAASLGARSHRAVRRRLALGRARAGAARRPRPPFRRGHRALARPRRRAHEPCDRAVAVAAAEPGDRPARRRRHPAARALLAHRRALGRPRRGRGGRRVRRPRASDPSAAREPDLRAAADGHERAREPDRARADQPQRRRARRAPRRPADRVPPPALGAALKTGAVFAVKRPPYSGGAGGYSLSRTASPVVDLPPLLTGHILRRTTTTYISSPERERPAFRPGVSCLVGASVRRAPVLHRRRRLRQQVLEVEVALERLAHVDLAVGAARPLVERAVPAQLEVVAVRVGDVDRLVRAVVGALAQRPVDRLQPPQRVGQPRPRRVADRDVVQARDAVGLRPAARRLPSVEPEVVVIAAGGDEQDVARRAPAGHVARLHHDVEAHQVDVERADAVDVRRPQVDVADRHAGLDRLRRSLPRDDRALEVLVLGCAGHSRRLRPQMPRHPANRNASRTVSSAPATPTATTAARRTATSGAVRRTPNASTPAAAASSTASAARPARLVHSAKSSSASPASVPERIASAAVRVNRPPCAYAAPATPKAAPAPRATTAHTAASRAASSAGPPVAVVSAYQANVPRASPAPPASAARAGDPASMPTAQATASHGAPSATVARPRAASSPPWGSCAPACTAIRPATPRPNAAPRASSSSDGGRALRVNRCGTEPTLPPGRV